MTTPQNGTQGAASETGSIHVSNPTETVIDGSPNPDRRIDPIWQERADYVDVLLYVKHEFFARKTGMQSSAAPRDVTVKQAIINSLRRRTSNPKVYYNPVVRLLFKIKNKLGIKFR